MAKLIVLARARMSPVTSAGGTLKISAAVCRWMSPPWRNASMKAGSSGEVGHDPKLDLGVVGYQEDPALPGDEARPDGLAPRGAYRNVLEIGLRRAEPAGGGAGLIEAGVDPPGAAIDPLRQRVHIGVLQLLQLAVLQNEPRKLVPHGRELLQHVGIGRRAGLGLLQHRQLMLLEQDAGQLARRIEVQVGARNPGNLLFQPAEILPQLLAQTRKTARSMVMPSHSISTSTSTRGISISAATPRAFISVSIGPKKRWSASTVALSVPQ